MVSVAEIREHIADLAPRRPATIASLDARLSVWGQAARDAAVRRKDALIEGSVRYVERVGRNASIMRPAEVDVAKALLDTRYDALTDLATTILPRAVLQSCRLLWVDPDRLRMQLDEELGPALEAARAEVRRRQALYRRRARLWQRDQLRLDRLREDVESIRVPRCAKMTPDLVARGLLLKHRMDAGFADVPPENEGPPPGLRLHVRPGNLSIWIAQFDTRIAQATR